MLKTIWSQIWNERKSNVYLFFELLLISVICWFCVDFLFVKGAIYWQPKGFDVSNCYSIKLGVVQSESTTYDKDAGEPSLEDLHKIIDRLKVHPDIESLTVSYGAKPYKWTIGQSTYKSLTDTLIAGAVETKRVTPEYFTVFRIHGNAGELPEEIAERFKAFPSDAICGTSQLIQSKEKDVSSLNINDFLNTVFTIRKESRLAMVVEDIKNRDTDPMYSNSIFIPFSFQDLGNGFLASEISFRVKADRNKTFTEQIRQGLQQNYREGNIIVKQIESYESMQDQMHLGIQRESKNYFFGILFLLINIVLGLLGIFWFRTQQRRCELALFMVVGASRVHIFLRLILEGVLLLTVATLPAMAIDYMIATNELTTLYQDTYLTSLRFASTVGITYLLMLMMIAVGIGIPAWRAMQIEPAEALHEE